MPWLAFGAISLIWGSTWLAHVYALVDLTPLGLATIRFGLAGLACVAIGLLRGETGPERRQLGKLLLAGLVLTGGANVLTAWSLNWLPSGIGAILQSPIPVWMALLSWRRDSLSARGWLGVLAGLAGVVLVLWPEQGFRLDLTAAMVCLGAGVVWSWAALYQRRHVKSGGMLVNAGLQMSASAAVGLLLTPFLGGYTTHGHVGLEAWLALAYLTVFGSLIAFTAFLYLTRVWHPARAGSFSYLNPIIAVWLGVAWNAEPITLRAMFGMAVVLGGVMLLQRSAGMGRRE